jgi:hypothetical protein
MTGLSAGRWHRASAAGDVAVAVGVVGDFDAAVAVDPEAITRPLIVSPIVTNPDSGRICLAVTTVRLILGPTAVTGDWQAVGSGEEEVRSWTQRL